MFPDFFTPAAHKVCGGAQSKKNQSQQTEIRAGQDGRLVNGSVLPEFSSCSVSEDALRRGVLQHKARLRNCGDLQKNVLRTGLIVARKTGLFSRARTEKKLIAPFIVKKRKLRHNTGKIFALLSVIPLHGYVVCDNFCAPREHVAM
jgi:hypothetical protein